MVLAAVLDLVVAEGNVAEAGLAAVFPQASPTVDLKWVRLVTEAWAERPARVQARLQGGLVPASAKSAAQIAAWEFAPALARDGPVSAQEA